MLTRRAAHVLAVICCWIGPAHATGTPSTPPNILVLVADDYGVDQLGVFGIGSDLAVTPNLDALAAGGLTFENAWATPLCSPTRACLLTGRLPNRTRIGDILDLGGYDLPLTEFLLPEAVDAAASGYAHAAIGKWHLSSTPAAAATGPLDAGFGYWSGTTSAIADYYNWSHSVNGTVTQNTQYVTGVQVDETLKWIDTQTGPWFCYLSFHAPHEPYHFPPSGTYSEDLTGLDPTVVQRPFYKAMVENMDYEIGRLFAGLGTRLDNTLVIFLGDNGTPGESIAPPLNPTHDKGTVYQGGVHVPLLVSGPLVGRPGTTCNLFVHAVDLYSTVLELAGVSPSPTGVALDSISFADEITYAGGPRRQYARSAIYTEWFTPNGTGPEASRRQTARNWHYKLSKYDTSEEFYDLQSDPQETTNLLPLGLTGEALWNYVYLETEIIRRGG